METIAVDGRAGKEPRKGPDSVQSLSRAFELLELMAEARREIGVTELATTSALPVPTIHRLLRTLVAKGYVRQGPSRRYGLGPGFIRLGESASRALGIQAKPRLTELAELAGETANMAMLDGDDVVYVAQAPSHRSVRMFIEVGRRVHPHCTGVGKALLSQLPDDVVQTTLRRSGMPSLTPATLTEPSALMAQLAEIRHQGFAVDEGEQEQGVRCFAVPVPGGPVHTAISVSGPAGRMGDETRARVIPLMKETARRIADDIADATPGESKSTA